MRSGRDVGEVELRAVALAADCALAGARRTAPLGVRDVLVEHEPVAATVDAATLKRPLDVPHDVVDVSAVVGRGGRVAVVLNGAHHPVFDLVRDLVPQDEPRYAGRDLDECHEEDHENVDE